METEKPKPVKKKGSNLGGAIVVIVFFAIIIGAFMLLTGGAKAKYEVSNSQITVVDDATVSVGFKVKNTGKADGKPFCTVNAHNPDSSNYGGNTGQLSSTIKAGDTYTTAMPVTVTNQGANTVTVADVSCR